MKPGRSAGLYPQHTEGRKIRWASGRAGEGGSSQESRKLAWISGCQDRNKREPQETRSRRRCDGHTARPAVHMAGVSRCRRAIRCRWRHEPQVLTDHDHRLVRGHRLGGSRVGVHQGDAEHHDQDGEQASPARGLGYRESRNGGDHSVRPVRVLGGGLVGIDPIMASISRPPVLKNRTTSTAARARKAMLRNVV